MPRRPGTDGAALSGSARGYACPCAACGRGLTPAPEAFAPRPPDTWSREKYKNEILRLNRRFAPCLNDNVHHDFQRHPDVTRCRHSTSTEAQTHPQGPPRQKVRRATHQAEMDDNNNYGRHAMGSENWAPSSRVLQRPGGTSTINLFGGYGDDSPAPRPTSRAGGARIIGGKIVLPETEQAAAAAHHTAAVSAAPAQHTAAPAEAPATAGPEMRGCEGYQPNHAAFANGGLQSSSTELKGPQQVGRSSTRLHAPPGGASQISFGSYSEPAPARPQQQQQQQRQQSYGAGAPSQSPARKAVVPHKNSQLASSISFGCDAPAAKPAPLNPRSSNANISTNGVEPEMRGCEGYQPNHAAFANGGLQSSSTELKGPQQVGRSSTRLHAPPGGASSIVFG